MTNSIMLPVDLAHKRDLATAVNEAVNMANLHSAKLTIVGVTGSAPTDVADNPKEYDAKLHAFSEEIAKRTGLAVDAKSLVDVDVAADLGRVLVKTASDLDADLIVMASHVPGFIEHIFASNAGYVASHAKCSVYVVR